MGCNFGAVLLLLGIAVLGIVNAQNTPCRTPNNEIGDCRNLKLCPELLSILTTTPRRSENIEFLKRSQCGFDHNDPLVCCVDRNSNVDGRNPSNNNDANSQTGNFNDGRVTNPTTNPGNGNIGPTNNDLLPNDCGRDLSNRIVGGNVTELDEFPWMALLEYSTPKGKTTACGGALINQRYILTAAHCLKGRALPSTWRLQSVRLGEYNTATDRDCIPDGDDAMVCADDPVSVGIEEQIAHEDYAPFSTDQRYDIALLRLTRNVQFTDFIKPICLPKTSNLSSKLQVAGWGKTEVRSESEIKLKVSLPLVDKTMCSATYQNAGVTLGEGQICAGGEKGKDSCRGDSGGPIMQQERTEDGSLRWNSVGVVSFGPSPCGMAGWPAVYTKVYDYMPWILNKMRP